MPFRGFENFDDCLKKITASGKAPDAAKKICGKFQSQAEGKTGEIEIADAECIKFNMEKGMSRADATEKCYDDSEEMEAVVAATALEYADGEILEDDGKGSTEVIVVENSKKYPWGKCVSDQVGKGYSKQSATKICANIRNKSKGFGGAVVDKKARYDLYEAEIKAQSYKMGQIVMRFAQQDRLFIKAFLLSSAVNLNRWGVTHESIAPTIGTFIGKPLVLTEDFGHPAFEDDSITHALRFQEEFRIGNIVDVVPDRSGNEYFAIIEITDDNAKRAFGTGDLPLYVSPAIAKLNFDEPEDAISSWTGVHLAIVDDPAFTVKHATITGRCSGDENTCLLQLRRAKIEKDGYGACNFCTFGKLTSVLPKEELEKRDAAVKAVNEIHKNIAEIENKTVSSLVSNTQNSSSVELSNNNPTESTASAVEKTESPPSANIGVQTNTQKAEVTPQQAQPTTDIQRKNVTVTPENSGSFYEGELHSLRVQNELKDKLIAGLKAELTSAKKELEVVRSEGRRAAIETVITADIYPNEAERQEKVTELIQTGLSVDQVRAIYQPLIDMKKSQDPQTFTASRDSSGKVQLRNNPEIRTARRDVSGEDNVALEVNSYIVKEGGV